MTPHSADYDGEWCSVSVSVSTMPFKKIWSTTGTSFSPLAFFGVFKREELQNESCIFERVQWKRRISSLFLPVSLLAFLSHAAVVLSLETLLIQSLSGVCLASDMSVRHIGTIRNAMSRSSTSAAARAMWYVILNFARAIARFSWM